MQGGGIKEIEPTARRVPGLAKYVAAGLFTLATILAGAGCGSATPRNLRYIEFGLNQWAYISPEIQWDPEKDFLPRGGRGFFAIGGDDEFCSAFSYGFWDKGDVQEGIASIRQEKGEQIIEVREGQWTLYQKKDGTWKKAAFDDKEEMPSDLDLEDVVSTTPAKNEEVEAKLKTISKLKQQYPRKR